MKFKLFLFLLTLCPIMSFGQSSIKSAKITFNFESKDVDGTISGFKSESKIDLENPENSKLKGSVSVKSIKTGIFLRDWSLKGSKYFDEDLHPRINFVSNSVTADSDGFIVKGTLTIKNIDKPMTIDFTKNGTKLVGKATVNSSDFGINIKKNPEDNKVAVKIVFELE